MNFGGYTSLQNIHKRDESLLFSKEGQVSLVLRHLLEIGRQFIVGLKIFCNHVELWSVDSSLLGLQIFLTGQRRSGMNYSHAWHILLVPQL